MNKRSLRPRSTDLPSPTFSTRRTLRRRVASIACFARVLRSQTVRKCHLDLDGSARISPKNVGIHQVRAFQLNADRTVATAQRSEFEDDAQCRINAAHLVEA